MANKEVPIEEFHQFCWENTDRAQRLVPRSELVDHYGLTKMTISDYIREAEQQGRMYRDGYSVIVVDPDRWKDMSSQDRTRITEMANPPHKPGRRTHKNFLRQPDLPGVEVLRVETGSRAAGTHKEDSDSDQLGVLVENETHVYGTEEFSVFSYKSPKEEQYPNDVDLAIHGLRHWMRSALNGGLRYIEVCYAPVVFEEEKVADMIRDLPDLFRSEHTYMKLRKHIRSYAHPLAEGKGDAREVKDHGYDPKIARGMLKAAFQSESWVTDGTILYPLPESQIDRVRLAERGELSLEEVLKIGRKADESIAKAEAPRKNGPLPTTVSRRLRHIYEEVWS